MTNHMHIHDCDKCKYHGSFFHEEHDRFYDVYTCLNEMINYSSLILRYSSEGFDYLSSWVNSVDKSNLEPHYKNAFEIIYGLDKKLDK
jgi:hypothetical protein